MTSKTTAQLHPAYGTLLLAVAIEPEEIGRRIKAARKRKHWTQVDFLLAAHVGLSSVARCSAGETRKALSKEYGVHLSTVARIVNGLYWKPLVQ